MQNHPDPEYQRLHLLRAIRHAQIDPGELWLHYFGLAGDAGEYEVEAYLHGSFMLPPLQRDLLAHAANELIDRLPQPPRAPYSTDLVGDDDEAGDEAGKGEPVEEAAPPRQDPGGYGASPLDWLLGTGSEEAPDTGRADGPEGHGSPDSGPSAP